MESLSCDVRQALAQSLGFHTLLPVQTAVIPCALDLFGGGSSGDLCVSAATGSGKTLSYLLPVIEALRKRRTVRLRALVVVPTRDLAAQVAAVAGGIAGRLGLVVASISGETPFSEEQRQLVTGYENDMNENYIPESGLSRIDILVTTPGRLVDHINGTPGFTLQHVKYLVIDEVDRLLRQSYQGWLRAVLDACSSGASVSSSAVTSMLLPSTFMGHDTDGNDNHDGDDNNNTSNPFITADGALDVLNSNTQNRLFHRIAHPVTRRGAAGACCTPPACSVDPERTALHKLLFSATLTRNPKKIAALGLVRPRFLAPLARRGTTLRYRMPEGLTEKLIVCRDRGEKPLALLHIIDTLRGSPMLCFASSVESAHRLYRLLEAYRSGSGKAIKQSDVAGDGSNDNDDDGNTDKGDRKSGKRKRRRNNNNDLDADVDGWTVAEYSSALPAAMRTAALESLRAGRTSVLICSDAAARGIDVSGIAAVVNYDAPKHVKTYVHRAGRTARAGAKGSTYTILSPHEVAPFQKMIAKADKENEVDRIKLSERQLEPYVPRYQLALAALRDVVAGERLGRIAKTDRGRDVERARAKMTE